MRFHSNGRDNAGTQPAARTDWMNGRGLEVAVVHTTREGTLAALRSAGNLAKDLGARIALVAPLAVPFRLPLDRPTISTEFVQARHKALIAEADLGGEDVDIQIWICRNPREALAQILAPGSLVVLGGKGRWYLSQEQRLGRFLARLGHHVIFVDAAKISVEPNLRDLAARSTQQYFRESI